MSPKILLLLLCLFELGNSLGFGMGGGGGGCCCGGCGGCGGGGGGCCGGGGAFGRKKRSTDEYEHHLTQSSSKDPSCNNEHLRELMQENMGAVSSQSEDKISKALESESSSFAVLCSNDTIAFKASPHMIHCTFVGTGHQCVAFSL